MNGNDDATKPGDDNGDTGNGEGPVQGNGPGEDTDSGVAKPPQVLAAAAIGGLVGGFVGGIIGAS